MTTEGASIEAFTLRSRTQCQVAEVPIPVQASENRPGKEESTRYAAPWQVRSCRP